MEFAHASSRSRNIDNPQRTIQEDDGYWEALLTYGEVVTQEAPPPWINSASANGGNVFGRSDDEIDSEERDWQRAEDLMTTQSHCCLVVTGYNRGGLLVSLGCLSGFVPGSHLLDFPVNLDYEEREAVLARRIGEELKLQVIEIDRPRSRLVLSERVACVEERSESLFARLRVGDIVRGQVSNLRRFGAFVDLGGYEGLLHISELSWGRVNDPGDVVHVGQEIEVYVLDINHEERKIQLSLKHLQSDPWQGVSQRYTVGDLVTGEVTNVVNFGAFTRLEDGVEGLIHISELAEGTFLHPRNVVSEGQQVRVRVLAVDPVHRRIGLSLRQARDAHEAREQRRADAHSAWS
ncbi:MAG: S1 RNA-binding domain-containing protein [Caldilineales bacterium]